MVGERDLGRAAGHALARLRQRLVLAGGQQGKRGGGRERGMRQAALNGPIGAALLQRERERARSPVLALPLNDGRAAVAAAQRGRDGCNPLGLLAVGVVLEAKAVLELGQRAARAVHAGAIGGHLNRKLAQGMAGGLQLRTEQGND